MRPYPGGSAGLIAPQGRGKQRLQSVEAQSITDKFFGPDIVLVDREAHEQGSHGLHHRLRSRQVVDGLVQVLHVSFHHRGVNPSMLAVPPSGWGLDGDDVREVPVVPGQLLEVAPQRQVRQRSYAA